MTPHDQQDILALITRFGNLCERYATDETAGDFANSTFRTIKERLEYFVDDDDATCPVCGEADGGTTCGVPECGFNVAYVSGELQETNEQLFNLATQAGLKKQHGSDREYVGDFDWRLFSQLLIKQIQNTIQQEWYDLNNAPKAEDEDARAIGIRIGKKSGLMIALNKIRNGFDTE